jgi:hypothetical protein
MTTTAAPGLRDGARVWQLGDIVRVSSPKWPGDWEIVKVNPVNLGLVNTATGQRLRCHPSFIAGLASDTPAARPAGVIVESVPLPPLSPRFPVGAVVTVAGSAKMGAGPYVVLAETGASQYRLAKLGGDNFRYWRSIDGHRMTLVDPSRITITNT